MAEAPLLTSSEEVVLGKKIQQLNAWEAVRNTLYEEAGGVVAPTATSGALGGSNANGKSAYAADMDAKVSLEAWAKAVEFEGDVPEFQRLVLEYRHAKDVMINSNMRLVISIARRYQHLGVSLQDLIQEGSLGLIRASEKFDPSRGFRFSTYASWWIQQAVFRSIAFHSRIIRLPMHVHNMLNRVRNTRKEIFMETGRVPSEEELAVRLDVPLDKLRLVMRSSRRIYSSNAPVQAKKRRGSGAGELSREMELCYEDQNEAEGKLPEEVSRGHRAPPSHAAPRRAAPRRASRAPPRATPRTSAPRSPPARPSRQTHRWSRTACSAPRCRTCWTCSRTTSAL